MIKNNVQLKETLSVMDKINYINFLVDGYFDVDDDGDINYTPYFREINDISAFFSYCVTGLEFETITDRNGNKTLESVYQTVIKDKELMNLYSLAFASYIQNPLKIQLEEINSIVMDIVEFEKQKIIHAKRDSLAELVDLIAEKLETTNLEEVIGKLQKLADITTQDVVNEYMSSEYHKKNEKALFDSKNEEIKKLKEENIKLKNQISARNVVNNYTD